MRILTLFLMLISAIFVCNAQESEKPQMVPFNGHITDENGQGIKVRIKIKDTDLYTISYKDGRFGLSDLMEKDILSIKYKKNVYEIPVGQNRSLEIVLKSDGTFTSKESEELIAKGEEYVKQREMDSSGGGLTASFIERYHFLLLSDAMRVKLPGVEISTDGSVIIRGVNSINNPSSALILCDGNEISSVDAVNIHDVERVDVEKDGSMYGFRGVGGVIKIKTKSGSSINKQNK
ncbi:MAG: TonB-dependent receptor plug domain-containing protein [Alistipes sp.]|nr:TonB-dependent receptor plug domain-containing protein [Candidatus Alistipes equi]